MAQITFNIPDNKLAAFKTGFLEEWPTPDGMSDNEWIKQWGKEQYIDAYKRGVRKLATKAALIDNDIIS